MSSAAAGAVGSASTTGFPSSPPSRSEISSGIRPSSGTGAPKRWESVAATLSQRFGAEVPLLGRIPIEISLREGGDDGKPVVEADPTAPAARELARIAETLTGRGRGLAGLQLGLTPASRF